VLPCEDAPRGINGAARATVQRNVQHPFFARPLGPLQLDIPHLSSLRGNLDSHPIQVWAFPLIPNDIISLPVN